MRAPSVAPVDFPLGPDRRWQLLLTAAFVFLVLTQLIWWRAQLDAHTPSTTLYMAVFLSLLATIGLGHALWRLRRPAARHLRHAGTGWQLVSPGSAPQRVTVDVAIDLGGWLLLRLHPQGAGAASIWLPMAADRQPRRWHALRCALANSANPGAEGRREPAA